MKNWRNSEPFLNRDGGCRHCIDQGHLHKIKEAIYKTANRFRNLWSRRKREYEHTHEHTENKQIKE